MKIPWHQVSLCDCGRALLLAMVAGQLCTGCGNYPKPLNSAWQISTCPANVTSIQIADLPLRDYPRLSKFRKLKVIQFYKAGSTGATDAELRAIADIGFQGLEGLDLLHCRSVTDAGIEALTRIRSLRWLQLEGTRVSDNSLLTLSKMPLTGLNLALTGGISGSQGQVSTIDY